MSSFCLFASPAAIQSCCIVGALSGNASIEKRVRSCGSIASSEPWNQLEYSAVHIATAPPEPEPATIVREASVGMRRVRYSTICSMPPCTAP